MQTAIVKTREELLEWKRQLLAQVKHLSEHELYELGAHWELRSDERDVYETLRSIDYLLGDDACRR